MARFVALVLRAFGALRIRQELEQKVIAHKNAKKLKETARAVEGEIERERESGRYREN